MDKYVIDLDKVLDELELNDKYDESNDYNSTTLDSAAQYNNNNNSVTSLINISNNNNNEKIDLKDADFSIHVKPPKFLRNNNYDSNNVGNENIFLIEHNNNIQTNVEEIKQIDLANKPLSSSSLSSNIIETTSHDILIDNDDNNFNRNSMTSDNFLIQPDSLANVNYDNNKKKEEPLEICNVQKQTSVIDESFQNVDETRMIHEDDDATKNDRSTIPILIEDLNHSENKDKTDIIAVQEDIQEAINPQCPKIIQLDEDNNETSCDKKVKDLSNSDSNFIVENKGYDDEQNNSFMVKNSEKSTIDENQPSTTNIPIDDLNTNDEKTIIDQSKEISTDKPSKSSSSSAEMSEIIDKKLEKNQPNFVKEDHINLDEDAISKMAEEDLDKYLNDLKDDLETLEATTTITDNNNIVNIAEPSLVCQQQQFIEMKSAVKNNSISSTEINDVLIEDVVDDEEGVVVEQKETAVSTAPLSVAPNANVDDAAAAAQNQFDSNQQNEIYGPTTTSTINDANNEITTEAQLKELEELLAETQAQNNNNFMRSENRGGLVQNINYFERQEMPNGLTEEEQMLGKVKPFWIPDEDAQNCLHCDVKFTLIKRRHHCRSCGKVLCSQCCNFKAKLPYLEYKEARVCQLCYGILMRIEEIERINGHQIDISNAISNLNQSLEANRNSGNSNNNVITVPDPNNPSEYCSTIPPLEQISEQIPLPPPTVMVPVGVLKRPGSSNIRRSNNSPESSSNSEQPTVKQVMFSDGVRPGGDLVEPSSSTTRLLPADEQKPITRTQLQLKSPLAEKILVPFENISKRIKMSRVVVVDCNGTSLPPIINYNELKSIDSSLPSKPNYSQLIELLRNPSLPCITFGLTKNLHINAKIISKTCCNSKECWSFFSKGLASSGQDEVLLLLDCDSLKRSNNVIAEQTTAVSAENKKSNNNNSDDNNVPSNLIEDYNFPRDVFRLYTTIYDSASSATLYMDLTHIFFPDGLFQNKENSGFIFTRPTLQCFQNITVPAPPFLIAILIHKWEIPWAKVFPLRLVLRLGYEYKSYPSPVISYANRKSTYFEIGHTIMNVLADFRNFHYTLSVVKDLFICVEERKRVNLLIQRVNYEKVCKVLSTSNEHVLAFGGNLSLKADSHFVCVQNEDDDDSQYHTQLFSYPGSPEKLTGASFIVFSGALKSSTGLKAKMNIVEDGLLVQIPPTMMEELRSAIKDMKDFKIDCCKVNDQNSSPEEYVQIQWVNDELSTNLGVRSQIDGLNLEGIQSARIFSNPDYANERYLIRWIEVFLLQINENSRRSEMINANRLAESVAQAFCVALIDYLDQLYETGLTKISLRISLDVDKVGYETGSGGKPLPTQITQPLDNALIPVIMENISTTGIEDPLVIELLFFVLLK